MSEGFLFAFSGTRANRKEEVFYATRQLAREQYPDQPLVFMDDIVMKKPLPLNWSPEHRALHPTTRLLAAFAEFNEAGIRRVRPEIENGNTVITLRYGLDLFLDSVAQTDCQKAVREAFELWHGNLVPARVVRGTPKPQYLISPLRPTEDRVIAFCSRQAGYIKEYFEGTGQKLPIYLGGTSVQECAKEALGHILSSVLQRRSSVA